MFRATEAATHIRWLGEIQSTADAPAPGKFAQPGPIQDLLAAGGSQKPQGFSLAGETQPGV